MGYSKKVTTRGMVPDTQELVMTILHGVFFQILVDNPTAPPPMGGPVPTQEKKYWWILHRPDKSFKHMIRNNTIQTPHQIRTITSERILTTSPVERIMEKHTLFALLARKQHTPPTATPSDQGQ